MSVVVSSEVMQSRSKLRGMEGPHLASNMFENIATLGGSALTLEMLPEHRPFVWMAVRKRGAIDFHKLTCVKRKIINFRFEASEVT